jgi:hypothetical protein
MTLLLGPLMSCGCLNLDKSQITENPRLLFPLTIQTHFSCDPFGKPCYVWVFSSTQFLSAVMPMIICKIHDKIVFHAGQQCNLQPGNQKVKPKERAHRHIVSSSLNCLQVKNFFYSIWIQFQNLVRPLYEVCLPQCFFWEGETYTQGQCMTVNFGRNVTYWRLLTQKKHWSDTTGIGWNRSGK